MAPGLRDKHCGTGRNSGAGCRHQTEQLGACQRADPPRKRGRCEGTHHVEDRTARRSNAERPELNELPREIRMIDSYTDRDAAANLLERRWFSSIAAVRAAETECEVLREVLELADSAWRRARIQLADLECLRDALADEVMSLDSESPRVTTKSSRLSVMSAA